MKFVIKKWFVGFTKRIVVTYIVFKQINNTLLIGSCCFYHRNYCLQTITSSSGERWRTIYNKNIDNVNKKQLAPIKRLLPNINKNFKKFLHLLLSNTAGPFFTHKNYRQITIFKEIFSTKKTKNIVVSLRFIKVVSIGKRSRHNEREPDTLHVSADWQMQVFSAKYNAKQQLPFATGRCGWIIFGMAEIKFKFVYMYHVTTWHTVESFMKTITVWSSVFIYLPTSVVLIHTFSISEFSTGKPKTFRNSFISIFLFIYFALKDAETSFLGHGIFIFLLDFLLFS